MMEKYIDRTEVTLNSPEKEQLSAHKDRPIVRNGHDSNSAEGASCLTNDDIEQTVLSTTSIAMENKVSIDKHSNLNVTDNVFSNSSSVEDEISIKLSTSPTSKDKEEGRTYTNYTPGFSIRAWAYEDIQHKQDPVSSKITEIEHKERKTSVTSTLTINKNKDFDLEKNTQQTTEISSLSMNVGKSPRKETSTAELTFNKPLDYDLEDRSPQKKEFSHLNFEIGKANNQNGASSSTKVTKTFSKSLTMTEKITFPEKNIPRSSPADQSKQREEDWVIIPEQIDSSKATVLKSAVASKAAVSETTTKAKANVVYSTPVEVERKFTVGPDTEAKLVKLGATPKGVRVFTDVYFDNEAYSLTLSDCWLRKRNTLWEMKIPVDGINSPIFDMSTKYRELTKESDIVDFIRKKLSLKSTQLSKLVEEAKITSFATIVTSRKTYSINGCEVVLDVTDHGFQVGEIEVMASSSTEVFIALKTIENMRQSLGWTPLQLVF